VRGSLYKVAVKKPDPRKGVFTWQIILSLGRGPDGRYKQRWLRVHGTRQEAESKLTELLGQLDKGELVEPSKLTVGGYLDEWLNTTESSRAPGTHRLYTMIINHHLKPALGHVLLQKLNVLHIERYYTDTVNKGSKTSAVVRHAVLVKALNDAMKKHLIQKNVASLAANKPKTVQHTSDSLTNVWTAPEANSFLVTVKEDGTAQWIALFALLLDSGARKNELLGLQWRDLDGNKLRIERQLLKCNADGTPVFAPPKRGGIRSLDLSDETVALLREHKKQQSEVKMANRLRYRDHGLMFAQSWENLTSKRTELGAALVPGSVNKKLAQVCKPAHVRVINVHGLRHTCATLLLSAGVPPHVVQRRLGHKKVEMTLNLYSHVLPSMQADAASRLASLLHG
jgi:integrase